MNTVDPRLWKRLQARLPSGELKLDETAIANHSGDKWFATARPEAVALPRSVKSVSAIMRFAYRHQIPVTPRGAGFGYVGGCVPLKGGIALSTVRMKRIKEINENDFVAVVQPGVIPADPASQGRGKGACIIRLIPRAVPIAASRQHCHQSRQPAQPQIRGHLGLRLGLGSRAVGRHRGMRRRSHT